MAPVPKHARLSSQHSGAPETKERSLVSDAAIVSIATLVSRILGFIRLMVALYVLSKVVNDVFQLANLLPNQVYDLIISSAFSAVLVPAIVGSRHQENRNQLVTALFTVGSAGLFVVTAIATAAAPILVRIMGVNLPPGWYSVAVAFAFWCLPQIFFYGLHALLGQYLNANRRFLAYAITPALNNVVAIAGLLYFMWLYGQDTPAGQALQDPANWDARAVAALAVPTTLGIVIQALALIPSVHAAGFRMVFPIRVRGLGLGRTLREGLWATMIVGANYLRVWAITNVAVTAFAWGNKHGVQVPAMTDSFAASLFYALPYSVLILSVVAVIFPRIVSALVDDGPEAVRALVIWFHSNLAPLTVFCTVVLVSLSLPLAQFLTYLSDYDPYLVALALSAAAIQLVPATTGLLNQRLLFADGRAIHVFFASIPAAVFVLAGAWVGVWLLPAMFWLPAALVVDAIGSLIASVTMHFMIAKPLRVPLLTEASYYLRPIIAGVLAGLAGFAVLRLVGFYSSGLWDLAARGLGIVTLELVIFGVVGMSGQQRRELVRLLTRRNRA